jgi:hypothetical protein
MQTKSPSLLPVFRSRALAALLTRLFVRGDVDTISGLAGAVGAAPSTIKREIDELEDAGIVMSVRVGRSRVVRADPSSPFHAELRALLVKAFGPPAVVGERLADVAGIEEAYIFGSWAKRYGGEAGPAPRDVDVLVVGDPDPDAVYTAATDAERTLGIEVNITLATVAEWRDAASPFLSTVRAAPLVRLL